MTAPARSPADDALDRLRQQINKSRATYVPGTPEKYPATELRGLTVLEAEALLAQAEQLREELDEYAERLAWHREERDAYLRGNLWVTRAAEEQSRAEAAEAEVQRLTEGLREYGHHKQGCNQLKSPGLGRSPEFSGQECDCGLAALLSASPSGGGGAK